MVHAQMVLLRRRVWAALELALSANKKTATAAMRVTTFNRNDYSPGVRAKSDFALAFL
jgi:hypothetical protein